MYRRIDVTRARIGIYLYMQDRWNEPSGKVPASKLKGCGFESDPGLFQIDIRSYRHSSRDLSNFASTNLSGIGLSLKKCLYRVVNT